MKRILVFTLLFPPLVLAVFIALDMGRDFLEVGYLGQRGEILTFAAIGAIPAAMCSWLSEKIK